MDDDGDAVVDASGCSPAAVAIRYQRFLTIPLHRASRQILQVNPNITVPYAHLSLQMKQQFDSWEIITEADPFEVAEMFGNIGGFWGELRKSEVKRKYTGEKRRENGAATVSHRSHLVRLVVYTVTGVPKRERHDQSY